MKKHNQLGFTGFETVLVFLVVAVVTGAGFAVWHLQKNKPTTSSISSKGPVSKNYSYDGLAFSYINPGNLKVSEYEGLVILDSPDYNVDYGGAPRVLEGESIRLEGVTSDGVDQEGSPLHVTSDNYLTVNFSDAQDRAKVSKTATSSTINGIKTLQFDYEDTRETVFFLSNGKRIKVKLTYPRGSPITEHDTAYSQLINSIKL